MFNIGTIARAVSKNIQVLGVASGRVQTTGTLSVSVPAGAQSGDLLLVVVTCPHPTDVNLSLVTSGFSERLDAYQGSTDGFMGANLGVYTKAVGSTPDTQVQVTGLTPDGDTFMMVMLLRGVDTGTPMDVTRISGGGAPGSNVSVPAITPVTAGALIVGGGISASFYSAGTVNASPTVPSGWTLAAGVQRQASSTRVGNLCVAYKGWSGSGANPQSGNFGSVYTGGTSTVFAVFAIALRPAS